MAGTTHLHTGSPSGLTPIQGTIEGRAGFQQIAAATLVASTALTVPKTARAALIQVEAQAVRMRADGVAPTAAVGVTIASGDLLLVVGSLQFLRFINATAGTILNVQYFR